MEWIKITGDEDFPKYDDQILLCIINKNDENHKFCTTGYYSHVMEKYIVDDEQFYLSENHFLITHYQNIEMPKHNSMNEIQYQFEVFKRWVREKILRLQGVNRSFYCQRNIELKRKCKHQCDHCKEYYKPLELNQDLDGADSPKFVNNLK